MFARRMLSAKGLRTKTGTDVTLKLFKERGSVVCKKKKRRTTL